MPAKCMAAKAFNGLCASEKSLPLAIAYIARKLGHDLGEENAEGAARQAAARAAAAAALEQTGDSCGGDSGPRAAPERSALTGDLRGGPQRWTESSQPAACERRMV